MQHAIKNYGADLSLAQQKALLGMQAPPPPLRSARAPGVQARSKMQLWSYAGVSVFSVARNQPVGCPCS